VCSSDLRQSVNVAGENRIGRFAERRRDVLPFGIRQAFDVVKAATADETQADGLISHASIRTNGE